MVLLVFLVSNSNISILLAGCNHVLDISKMDAETNALTVELNNICNNNISVEQIFISYYELHATIKAGYYVNDWRSNHWVNIIRSIIISVGNSRIYMIPRYRIGDASKLAMHGSILHNISLFHQGWDPPRLSWNLLLLTIIIIVKCLFLF